MIMKRRLIQSDTEEDYTMEELIEQVKVLISTYKKEQKYFEFITQKPVYDNNGTVIGITTEFPAELIIYQS